MNDQWTQERVDKLSPRDWGEVETDPENECFGAGCANQAEKAAPFKSMGMIEWVGYCAKCYTQWKNNCVVQTEELQK